MPFIIFLLVGTISLRTAPASASVESCRIENIQLGRTTQTDLAEIWNQVPKIVVGTHPHSARQWHYGKATIVTDGFYYRGSVVVIDNVFIENWAGDLSRFYKAGYYPAWLKSLRNGESRKKIQTAFKPTSEHGDWLEAVLNNGSQISLRFAKGKLAAVICQLPEFKHATNRSQNPLLNFVLEQLI